MQALQNLKVFRAPTKPAPPPPKVQAAAASPVLPKPKIAGAKRAAAALPSADEDSSVNLLAQCETWRQQSPDIPFEAFFLSLNKRQQCSWIKVLGLRDMAFGQQRPHSPPSKRPRNDDN